MKSIHSTDVDIERSFCMAGKRVGIENRMSDNTRDNISEEDCQPNTLRQIFQTIKRSNIEVPSCAFK